MPIATAGQTIGPYWHLIEHPEFADLTRFGATGERIVLTGRVTDGDGAPVTDGCVELWQSSPEASETFPGYGRAATDPQGVYRLTTLKPGPVSGRGNTLQAPHLAINLLMRGVLTRLYTRAYFAGDELNDNDPLLAQLEDAQRRRTLIAQADGPGTWRFDIRLQGDGETVFIQL
ncbi:MAG: protocatechuate 3,4-dioxygenase subunit alpha [Acidisphaera sp.]|nr:protocatechuate 3,4-dioxygenase subunit alpha [Acidisphaera sp.]MBV9811870.1 protocatechuate 3,4-dioxygenase subunit alpha [Acetobacteraceae bacterium]